MVQYGIKHDTDTQIFRFLRQGKKLFLGAPFCSFAALLVKLSKIVKVIDVVARSLLVCTFAGLNSKSAVSK